MADAREYQVKKCYAWENALRKEFQIEPLRSKAELDQILLQVWNNEKDHFKRKHKRACPTIGDGRGCRNAKYLPRANMLVLPKWARTKTVLLHELAHYFEADWDNNPAHGAHWLGCFIYLLGKYATDELPLTESALVKTAQDAGLKVLSPFELNQELGNEFVLRFDPPTPKKKRICNFDDFNKDEIEHILHLQKQTGFTGRKAAWNDVGLVWQISDNSYRKLGYHDGVFICQFKTPQYIDECYKTMDWIGRVKKGSPTQLETKITALRGWK